MARQNFISRLFIRLKDIFSHQVGEGSHAASVNTREKRTVDRKRPDTTGDFPKDSKSDGDSRTNPGIGTARAIAPEFIFSYSTDLKTEVGRLSTSWRNSAEVMPSDLTPKNIGMSVQVNERHDLYKMVGLFIPMGVPELHTAQGMFEARKQEIRSRIANYNATLKQIAALVKANKFDEAERMNESLITGIEQGRDYEECLKRALANVTVISVAEETFRRAEEERRRREEEERIRKERERIRKERKSRLMASVDELNRHVSNGEWTSCQTLVNTLAQEVLEFRDSEVNTYFNSASETYESSYAEYRKEQARIRAEREKEEREAEERRIREEQERLRKEAEALLAEKKANLARRIEEFRSTINSGQWEVASGIKTELLNSIPTVHDDNLTSEFKTAATEFDKGYGEYLKERERVAAERQKAAEEKRRRMEEARRKKRIEDAESLLGRFHAAIDCDDWIKCELFRNKLAPEITSLNIPELTSRYSSELSLLETRRTSIEELERQSREQQLQKQREKEEEERRSRETAAKAAEENRIAAVKRKYIVQTGYDGFECVSLHKYYGWGKYHNDISSADIELRQCIWDFKDGKTQSARVRFANDVSSYLKEVYGDNLRNMWFCTAQASTSQNAFNRYHGFCQMVSNASGINNGYDLIEVTGEKASAHAGGGVRGDISNLTVSLEVRGKHIVLFDDVTTSGGTMKNLRNELLRRGAAKVDCLTFGKTV